MQEHSGNARMTLNGHQKDVRVTLVSPAACARDRSAVVDRSPVSPSLQSKRLVTTK